MSLDAYFLKFLTQELAGTLTGAKIEKIQQPARGSVVLTVKADKRVDLFLGGSSGSPRIHLTGADFEKPPEPPMFCMLLRKHLIGARILEVTQPALDRVLRFRLAAPGMFGEGEERGLVVELLGRTANVILTDGEGVITDCLYRVGSLEDKRMVLPGMVYRLPPMQDKRDLEGLSEEELDRILRDFDGEKLLDKQILGAFLGISPLIARELCFRAYGDTSPRTFEAEERDGLAALKRELRELPARAGEPWLLLDPEGVPFDFSYLPIRQYGSLYSLKRADSFSALLDDFYSRRDGEERRRQRARELTKTVKNARDRVARRLSNQREELWDTEKRDWYRECGDIITANIYAMKKGQSLLAAEDFYAPEGGKREIRLDPLKTPQQNAAKYYKDYNRAKSAQKHLTEQISAGEAELSYLESVLEELARAETVRDLADIRGELTDGGYLRAASGHKREKRQQTGPMVFRSDAGLEIRAGRSNTQNDALTLKTSAKTDIWLHTQKIHGSHVVISTAGGEVDELTLRQAASIAAWYSQGRGSGKVPVDYTLVKHVKKPSGARPGMVIYTDYKTMLAEPDEKLVERLRIK